MLKTAFIGNENAFNRKMCEWLSQHTDLRLIIWTNKLAWSSSRGVEGVKKVMQRFKLRSIRNGRIRTVNEILYFVLYRAMFARDGQRRLRNLVDSVSFEPRAPLSKIKQIRPDDIRSHDLQKQIEDENLDAMFAMCIDVYLPEKMINAPRLGTFLWHEGITPEYRGVHSPFWTLANQDYGNLGYTLLKMNTKWDAGAVFVQGKVENIDAMKDWHCYIGHKAIFDSLSSAENFLKELEAERHSPIDRANASDAYYSYPTGSALLKIVLRRVAAKFSRRPIRPDLNQPGNKSRFSKEIPKDISVT